MKKRTYVILILCVILISGYLIWRAIVPSYSGVLEANWGFELPVKALCSEVYEIDEGPSFHGDGIRYHVYEYKYEDYIDLMFAWDPTEDVSIYGKPYSEEVDYWLDRLEVPEDWRPNYSKCSYHYQTQHDNSQLLIFWDSELDRLYIAENFI